MVYESAIVRGSLLLSILLGVGLVGALGVTAVRERRAGREP
jgi:hypothetical protein